MVGNDKQVDDHYDEGEEVNFKHRRVVKEKKAQLRLELFGIESEPSDAPVCPVL